VKKYWRVGGSVALLAFLGWRLDWAGLGSAFGGLRLGPWLAAVVAYALAQTLSALRWQLLARSVGFGGGYGRYLAHYSVGTFFNLVLPTSVGGDVVRAWYLSRAEGHRGAALLSVFADRASGLAVLIVLACAAAACSPVPLRPWLVALVAGLGAAVPLGLLALPFLPALAARLPLIGARARGALERALEAGRAYLRRPRLLAQVTGLAVLIQAVNVALLWLIGLGLGLDVPIAYYGVVMPLVALLTLLPVSVNGVGLREWGTALLLAPLGVPESQAVALALLQSAAFSAVSLAGGGFYLLGRFAPPRGASMEVGADADPVRGGPDQGRARQPAAAA
jgi:uncharacterized membrane protein YbhN (UPF0104 family)